MSKNYNYKDQELDLKMRIKFLNKKLREPDHGIEQYEEWQSNLEMVTDELTKLQVKKFKCFLSKWIYVYKKDNQLINVTDCMFVSLEEDQQKDMATKWYHRTVKEKDIRHYQLLAQYTKEENQTLKKRLRDNIKKRDKEIKKLVSEHKQEFKKRQAEYKKQSKEAMKQSKEAIQQNFDKLLRQNVMELNKCRNKIYEQQEFIKTIDKENVYEICEKFKDLKAEIERLRESKSKILDEFKKMQITAKENSESENRTILELQNKILQLTEKQEVKQ